MHFITNKIEYRKGIQFKNIFQYCFLEKDITSEDHGSNKTIDGMRPKYTTSNWKIWNTWNPYKCHSYFERTWPVDLKKFNSKYFQACNEKSLTNQKNHQKISEKVDHLRWKCQRSSSRCITQRALAGCAICKIFCKSRCPRICFHSKSCQGRFVNQTFVTYGCIDDKNSLHLLLPLLITMCFTIQNIYHRVFGENTNSMEKINIKKLQSHIWPSIGRTFCLPK